MFIDSVSKDICFSKRSLPGLKHAKSNPNKTSKTVECTTMNKRKFTAKWVLNLNLNLFTWTSCLCHCAMYLHPRKHQEKIMWETIPADIQNFIWENTVFGFALKRQDNLLTAAISKTYGSFKWKFHCWVLAAFVWLCEYIVRNSKTLSHSSNGWKNVWKVTWKTWESIHAFLHLQREHFLNFASQTSRTKQRFVRK